MAEVSDTRIQCCIQPISGYDGYNNTMYLKLASLTSLDTMDTMLYPAQFWIQWIRRYHVGFTRRRRWGRRCISGRPPSYVCPPLEEGQESLSWPFVF